MCVIVIKPRGKRLPPKSILKKCWSHNSHGAGYAINVKGESKTRVQKGFMDFDAFYKALSEENVSKRDLLLLHFRWATHGNHGPEHTHPFPISNTKKDLELLAYKTNMICAHNGVFNLINQPKDISDTMYFIQSILCQLKLSSINSSNTEVKKIIEEAIKTSKIALIIDGSLHMLGAWQKYQGCFYSNLNSVESKKWKYESYPCQKDLYANGWKTSWQKHEHVDKKYSRTNLYEKYGLISHFDY